MPAEADAIRADPDSPYQGIAPASVGPWPSLDPASVYVKRYDTGVVEYQTEIQGVEFTCLYDEVAETARAGWGR